MSKDAHPADLIAAAKAFAMAAHEGQQRKYVGGPYIAHVEEVARLVEEAMLSPAAQAAAWLHDTVEDCAVTAEEIDHRFGRDVGEIVRALTNTADSAGGTEAERKAKDIARLGKASSDAQSIKCADLISNISTIVARAPEKARTYVPARRKVLDVLTRADPALRARAERVMRDAEQAATGSPRP